MTRIALAHTFVSAASALDAVAAKQTSDFLERLSRNPDSVAPEADAGRPAGEHSADILYVSEDLRVISRSGDDLLLVLYVGRYNEAYDWACQHCTAPGLPRAGRRIPVGEIPTTTVPGLAGAPSPDAWYCALSDDYDLSQAMEAAGIRGSVNL
jgi:hypothetical protein